MCVGASTVSWGAEYLSDRPQFFQLGSTLSDVVVNNVGPPQSHTLISIPVHSVQRRFSVLL